MRHTIAQTVQLTVFLIQQALHLLTNTVHVSKAALPAVEQQQSTHADAVAQNKQLSAAR
jgi:hypothetical protein